MYAAGRDLQTTAACRLPTGRLQHRTQSARHSLRWLGPSCLRIVYVYCMDYGLSTAREAKHQSLAEGRAAVHGRAASHRPHHVDADLFRVLLVVAARNRSSDVLRRRRRRRGGGGGAGGAGGAGGGGAGAGGGRARARARARARDKTSSRRHGTDSRIETFRGTLTSR